MNSMQRLLKTASLAVLLAFTLFIAPGNAGASDRYSESRSSFNDEYVFATTRGVNDLDMHPALKITLFPLTIVLDTVFLPFAVIAGFVTT